MRRIDISNPDGTLHEDAYVRILAHCYFPESEVDRNQALILYKDEAARFRALGPDAYKVSKVFKSFVGTLAGPIGKYYACGWVAAAMCELDGQGHEMSLNTAARMVAEMNGEYRRLEWVDFWGTEPKVGHKKTISTERDIKQAFREYQSVAHICAASVTSGEHLDSIHPLDRAPDCEACLIATAAFYQKKLQKAPRSSQWNMWDIAESAPSELQYYPPLLPSRQLLDAVFEPYRALMTARRG